MGVGSARPVVSSTMRRIGGISPHIDCLCSFASAATRSPRKDGGSDGRGVGFYFRNVTEILLFGVKGKNARTLDPGRSQVNMMQTRKREHSRKPDEQYKIIEDCSWGPRLEMFSRGTRRGWTVWGNQADDDYKPSWDTYSYNSAMEIAAE